MIEKLFKKYSNFYNPKYQINIQGEDILQKYGINITAATAEESTNVSPIFSLIIDDPQLIVASNALFEIGKEVEIKMGYANALERIMIGQVTSVKANFPSNGAPQIEVFGENKNATPVPMGDDKCSMVKLKYGDTLLSANFEVTSKNSTDNLLRREPILKRQHKKVNVIRCSAQCLGIPEIKSGFKVDLMGLVNKYNRQYLIEKSVHSFGSNIGYKVAFDAKTEA